MQERNGGHDDGKSVPPVLLAEVRASAAKLREVLKLIELHIDDQHAHAQGTGDIDEMERLTEADPYRWLADAKHSLQAGVMFMERAVEQPTTF